MAVAENMMQSWQDTYTVRKVFGDPIEKGDVIVIPVAKIAGGAGGGSESGAETGEAGSNGSGFGGMAKPAGVFVVHADHVEWMPALDVTMLGIAGILLGGLITLVLGKALRRRR